MYNMYNYELKQCLIHKSAAQLIFTNWTHLCRQHPEQETEHVQHPQEFPSTLWPFPIPFILKVTVILILIDWWIFTVFEVLLCLAFFFFALSLWDPLILLQIVEICSFSLHILFYSVNIPNTSIFIYSK